MHRTATGRVSGIAQSCNLHGEDGSFYIVGRVGPGSGRVVESISTVKGHSAIPLDALLGSRLS